MTITLGILAGGRGARLRGRDKALLCVNGQTLLQRQVEPLRDWVSDVVVNSHRNTRFHAYWSNRVVCDLRPAEGPVSGLRSLLAACETEWLVVIPCDQWWISPEQLLELLNAAKAHKSGAAFALDSSGRHTPDCVLNRRCATIIESLWRGGCRSLRAAYEGLEAQPVAMATRDWDIDEWQDLKQLGQPRP